MQAVKSWRPLLFCGGCSREWAMLSASQQSSHNQPHYDSPAEHTALRNFSLHICFNQQKILLPSINYLVSPPHSGLGWVKGPGWNLRRKRAGRSDFWRPRGFTARLARDGACSPERHVCTRSRRVRDPLMKRHKPLTVVFSTSKFNHM